MSNDLMIWKKMNFFVVFVISTFPIFEIDFDRFNRISRNWFRLKINFKKSVINFCSVDWLLTDFDRFVCTSDFNINFCISVQRVSKINFFLNYMMPNLNQKSINRRKNSIIIVSLLLCHFIRNEKFVSYLQKTMKDLLVNFLGDKSEIYERVHLRVDCEVWRA